MRGFGRGRARAIEKLVASAADGSVDCSIDSGRELGQERGDEADCPTLAGVITVDDNATAGPPLGRARQPQLHGERRAHPPPAP